MSTKKTKKAPTARAVWALAEQIRKLRHSVSTLNDHVASLQSAVNRTEFATSQHTLQLSVSHKSLVALLADTKGTTEGIRREIASLADWLPRPLDPNTSGVLVQPLPPGLLTRPGKAARR